MVIQTLAENPTFWDYTHEAVILEDSSEKG